MTQTRSCDKHNFITPQQQQDNIPQASIPKVNVHQTKEQTHIQETVKVQDNLSKLNMYVSYVETKATMIINANLQLIFCKELKRHFNALITHMM